MPSEIVLPVKEANLLRDRMRRLLSLQDQFVLESKEKTIHDLRVSSRRLREVLEYLEPSLPKKMFERAEGLARMITKRLGGLRENEVNIGLLKKFMKEDRIEPIAAELLLHKLQVNFKKDFVKSQEKLSHKRFDYCEKTLTRIRGSRSLPLTNATVLKKRQEDFLNFSWDPAIDDERLHDLRIRTKKFRYSYEIYDRLHARNLGRFIRQIKFLQDVLGRIHDLYVLHEMIRRENATWNFPELSRIPAALQNSLERISADKLRLYEDVNPRYSRVVEKLMAVHVGNPQVA